MILGGRSEEQEKQNKGGGSVPTRVITELVTAMSIWVTGNAAHLRSHVKHARTICPGWARKKDVSIHFYIPCVLVFLGCHDKLPQKNRNLSSYSFEAKSLKSTS